MSQQLHRSAASSAHNESGAPTAPFLLGFALVVIQSEAMDTGSRIAREARPTPADSRAFAARPRFIGNHAGHSP